MKNFTKVVIATLIMMIVSLNTVQAYQISAPAAKFGNKSWRVIGKESENTWVKIDSSGFGLRIENSNAIFLPKTVGTVSGYLDSYIFIKHENSATLPSVVDVEFLLDIKSTDGKANVGFSIYDGRVLIYQSKIRGVQTTKIILPLMTRKSYRIEFAVAGYSFPTATVATLTWTLPTEDEGFIYGPESTEVVGSVPLVTEPVSAVCFDNNVEATAGKDAVHGRDCNSVK